MRCTACGADNAADARFCSQCGLPLGSLTGESANELTSTFHLATEDTLDKLLNPHDVAAVEALPAGNALLIVLKGPGAGSRFLLDQDEVLVGRHPDSPIFLDDVTVSRKHAAFVREGDSYAVADLGSLNGTYVNRIRIERATLRDGDEVQIGKFRLVFFLGSGGEAA